MPGYDAALDSSSDGVIDAHDGVANVVAFTNYHREGGLVVTKNVEGRGADFSRSFSFEARFSAADGSPLKGKYPLVLLDASGKEIDGTRMLELEGKEGECVPFALKDGQRAAFLGLPEGALYQVHEQSADEHEQGVDETAYTVRVTDASGQAFDGLVAKGAITDHTEDEVAFLNRFKTGEIHVKKPLSRAHKKGKRLLNLKARAKARAHLTAATQMSLPTKPPSLPLR